MKIAVIRRQCTYHRGGAEKYCADLCRHLAELGHRIYVVAEQCDRDLHPSIIHIPVAANKWTSPGRNRSFHINSQKALANLAIDCSLALSRTYPVDIYRVSDPLHYHWMSLQYRNRWLLAFQYLNPRHQTILSLDKYIFSKPNCNLIIANSYLVKNQLISKFLIPEEKIHVLYNGVDLENYTLIDSNQNPKDCTVHLLFVGNDFRRKGLEYVLKALRHLKQKTPIACTLTVVGRGNKSKYVKLAHQLQVEGQISFKGFSTEVIRYYHRADLLVLPSLYDPFANVCLEAMACGVPVVTTESNGASEIIEEGINGYILKPQMPLDDQIVDIIKIYSNLSDIEKRTRSISAHKRAMQFSIKSNVKCVANLLANI